MQHLQSLTGVYVSMNIEEVFKEHCHRLLPSDSRFLSLPQVYVVLGGYDVMNMGWRISLPVQQNVCYMIGNTLL